MKLVVVGGHSRDIGKTSVTAGIIAGSRELGWTALKITQYGHDICSSAGAECDCTVEDPDCSYAIRAEKDASGRTDTARFLQAGAREAYWLRTRTGQLAGAIPALRRLMRDREFVIVESNSVLEFLQPDLYLPVLKFDVGDFKASSQRYFDRADAYVVVGGATAPPQWSGVETRGIAKRPVFPVEPPSYSSAALVAFIRAELQLASV
ncbi:MAG: hypothetical protein GY953_13650 [bacterium]|nr:hypothetical protein [bacterium]